MADYRHSKVLEVQQRALDYHALKQAHASTILFQSPLTEKQV